MKMTNETQTEDSQRGWADACDDVSKAVKTLTYYNFNKENRKKIRIIRYV